MLESIHVEAFLDSLFRNDSTLIGGTALGSPNLIFRNHAKQGSTYPFLLYYLASSNDYTSLNKNRLFSEYVYTVKIVGEVKGIDLQNPSKVYAAADRIDALLNVRRQSFSVGGVTRSYNAWRESELSVREEEGETADVFYRNYGGDFRIQVF